MKGSVWIASYIALWLAVVVLAIIVVALLRQVGVLHARLRPLGTHAAAEGPALGTVAPVVDAFDYGESKLTLLAFTSASCDICHELVPSLRVIDRDYPGVRLAVVEHGRQGSAVFGAFSVASTPYLVAVDRNGVVRGRGVANSLEQAEVLVEDALASA